MRARRVYKEAAQPRLLLGILKAFPSCAGWYGTIQGHHITTPHATKHHIAILTKNNDFTIF
jgi:hypothetical protein